MFMKAHKKDGMRMNKLSEKSRDEKIPFHQNKINLSFRYAWDRWVTEWQPFGVYQDSNTNYSRENPFQHEKNLLKRRLNGFSVLDEYYWDILYDVNMRGKSLDQIMQEESKKDPDKEDWIKKELEDPNGAFKENLRKYYY